MKSRCFLGKCCVILAGVLFFWNLLGTTAMGDPFFKIERPHIGLKFSYEFDDEKTINPNFDGRDVSHTFIEGFKLQTGGWVYHPALMEYHLRVEPEFQQERQRVNHGALRHNDTVIQAYEAHASIFQYKPYTFTLFGSRTRDRLRASFTENTDTDTDKYGGTFSLHYPVLPTTFGYTHTEEDQKGFFDTFENRNEYTLSMRKIFESARIHLDGKYTDRDRTERKVDIRDRVTYITAGYNDDFSSKGKYLLSTTGFFDRETGSVVDSTSYNGTAIFNWRHRRNLSTRYFLSYDDIDNSGFRTQIARGDVTLVHLLYENLTTTLTLQGLDSSFTGGREDKYIGEADFDYWRRIPGGEINVFIDHAYERVDQSFGEIFRQVTDEPQNLTSGFATFLDNENVDKSSVVVSDTTGTITYIENIDYTLTESGNLLKVARTPFGAIVNGQAVLVDYRFLSNPAFDYDRILQRYGVSFNFWEAWRIYYSYERSRQSFQGGVHPDELQKTRIQRAGTELTIGVFDTSFSYEDLNDTLGSSTETWRGDEILTFPLRKNLLTRINGYYGETLLKDDSERRKLYGGRTNIQWMPGRYIRFEVEAFQDRVDGITEDFTNTGASSRLEIIGHVWHLGLFYRYLDQDDKFTDEERMEHSVLIEIRRELL